MSSPFGVRTLVGRTFSSVIDEIAPGWSQWGFSDGGRLAAPIAGRYSEEERQTEAESRRKFAPIRTALRDGTVVLVDVEGRVIPKRLWLSGRWGLFRDDERDIECLKEYDDTHRVVAEYYNPRFAAPASKKPATGGNKPYEDDEEIARGVELARANGLVWVRAAEALFDERHHEPDDPATHKQREDDRRRYVGRMRTTIRKAYRAKYPG